MADAGASINTKVELVVESVEDLANAIFDGRMTDRTDKQKVDKVSAEILDKRQALREHLRDFLAPRIRLIQGGRVPQSYVRGTLDVDKPRCTECLRNVPCPMGKGTQCEHWAAALRRKVNEGVGDEDGDVA